MFLFPLTQSSLPRHSTAQHSTAPKQQIIEQVASALAPPHHARHRPVSSRMTEAGGRWSKLRGEERNNCMEQESGREVEYRNSPPTAARLARVVLTKEKKKRKANLWEFQD